MQIRNPAHHPVEQIRRISGFQTPSLDPNFQSNFPWDPKLLLQITVPASLIFPGIRGVNQQQINIFIGPPHRAGPGLAAPRKSFKLLRLLTATFL